MVDRPENKSRYLILGSASPDLVKNASETLAGRVEFVELSGFGLLETGTGSADVVWLRGGFPRSFLARSNGDSLAWREGFIQTFLARDIPRLGISIPPAAMRRFWEGFAVEQILQIIKPPQAFFWATHSGAEIDLFFIHHGRRYGIECKFSETPKITKSMNQALESLNLTRLWVIYPGEHPYPLSKRISVWPMKNIVTLPKQLR